MRKRLILVIAVWSCTLGPLPCAGTGEQIGSEAGSAGQAGPGQWITAGTDGDDSRGVTVVRTGAVNIDYRIEHVRPEDLSQIELWYAEGTDAEWRLYDYDADMTSPVMFTPSSEGLYRLFVVAVDKWSRRSCRMEMQPDDSFQPAVSPGEPGQQVVFFDYIKPQLYLHRLDDEVGGDGDRKLRVLWDGYDTNLGPGCVRLDYQPEGSDEWRLIKEQLPASGQYSWLVPDGMNGQITLRAILADKAGNCDVQLSGLISVAEKQAVRRPAARTTPAMTGGSSIGQTAGRREAHPDDGLGARSDTYAKRAAQSEMYFRRGNLHNQRGETAQAVRAFERALQSDGSFSDARLALAQTYYRMNQFEEAQRQFERCLLDQPTSQTAMFGLAQSYMGLKRYPDAQIVLTRLLEQAPGDWQSWLLYGDVANELGQPEIAVQSWRKAAAGELSTIARMAAERIEASRQR